MSNLDIESTKQHPPERSLTIVLDDEPLEVSSRKATPDELLKLAGLNPATHYLVRIDGRERESFKGKGGEVISLHEGDRFVSVSTEPTPTS